MSKPKPWTDLEADILSVVKNSADKVTFAGLQERHPNTNPRVIDNALKRLKNAGLVLFDRKSRGWLVHPAQNDE